MSRIRTIKPEFPQSETVGKVSREARLLFLQLFTIVDDVGRARGAPRMLASLLYPYDDDAPALVECWLVELAREGLVTRYQVDGAQYLSIARWQIHQKIDRASPSRLPAPDDAVGEDIDAAGDEPAPLLVEPAAASASVTRASPASDDSSRQDSFHLDSTKAREDSSSPREDSRGFVEGSRGLATDLGSGSGPGSGSRPGSGAGSGPEPRSGSQPLSGPEPPNARESTGVIPRERAGDFETFWRVYPRRDGPNPRSPAERKFNALVASGVDPAMLIAAVKRLRAEQSAKNTLGTRFVPQAMTWLTQERWADHAEIAAEESNCRELPIDEAVRFFARTRHWSRWAGPEPGLNGCRASAELLAQHGLLPDGRPDPSFVKPQATSAPANSRHESRPRDGPGAG